MSSTFILKVIYYKGLFPLSLIFHPDEGHSYGKEASERQKQDGQTKGWAGVSIRRESQVERTSEGN